MRSQRVHTCSLYLTGRRSAKRRSGKYYSYPIYYNPRTRTCKTTMNGYELISPPNGKDKHTKYAFHYPTSFNGTRTNKPTNNKQTGYPIAAVNVIRPDVGRHPMYKTPIAFSANFSPSHYLGTCGPGPLCKCGLAQSTLGWRI